MKYDAMYFIKKFAAIPDDQWTIEEYVDSYNRHCALGHAGRRVAKETPEADALCKCLWPVEAINDGDYEYRDFGDTPKERILNALLLVNAGIEI